MKKSAHSQSGAVLIVVIVLIAILSATVAYTTKNTLQGGQQIRNERDYLLAYQAAHAALWDAERDFPIENHIMLEGTFVQVVQTVMDSLNDSDYPLQAALNPSTRVIRITRYLEPRRK